MSAIKTIKYIYHKTIQYATSAYCLMGGLHATYIEKNDAALEDTWHYKEPNCFIKNHTFTCGRGQNLSLILPLYNSSRFIDEIMGNLLNQKTEFSYEIIAIDDGSTDDTASKLQKWAKRYPQKIVAVYQSNGGIACARNSGIEHSRGEFIGFVDHDDMVSENYIQVLLSEAYDNHADSVNCGIEIVDLRDGHWIYSETGPYAILDGTGDGDLTILNGYIWGGIYRKEIFQRLRFPAGYWFEDFFTHPFVYRQCKRIVNLPDTLYKKRQHDKNAATILWTKKSPKCIEQVYLAEYIPLGNQELGLCEDWQMFRCILREVSGTLCVKTRGLDENTRKQCFRRGKELVQKYYKPEYLYHLNEHEQKYCKALLKGDYFLWRVLTKY